MEQQQTENQNQTEAANPQTSGCQNSQSLLDLLKLFLSTIYPKHDYDSQDSKELNKLKYMHSIMISRNWTIEDLRTVIKFMTEVHELNYWMPAHFIRYYRTVVDEDMVM